MMNLFIKIFAVFLYLKSYNFRKEFLLPQLLDDIFDKNEHKIKTSHFEMKSIRLFYDLFSLSLEDSTESPDIFISR